jgi:bifunctional DNA-binding transcriptional regulator/antitoxin component of YhaV-PrlF toxin-antitoxin module
MIIKLDGLSRMVIPKFVREVLGISPDGSIKLELEGKKLIMTKVE